MEGRLFTFLGVFGHNQEWMILSHLILTIAIVLLVARFAMKKFNLYQQVHKMLWKHTYKVLFQ